MVIGFSQDEYIGDEGEPGDVSRPNTPCTVTVEIFERSLEIPLRIRLTPGEGNATSKKVKFYYMHWKIGTHYRKSISVKYVCMEKKKLLNCWLI